MPDISKSFTIEKMRSGNAAVYLLREQFEKFQSAPEKVDACESIASCFYNLEQFEDAGGWYETAGKLILAQPSAVPAIKAMNALSDYERALDCYKKGDDEERFTEVSTLIRELRRACASA